LEQKKRGEGWDLSPSVMRFHIHLLESDHYCLNTIKDSPQEKININNGKIIPVKKPNGTEEKHPSFKRRENCLY
jgi:hypothetical protein